MRKAVDNLLLCGTDHSGYMNKFVSKTGGSSDVFAIGSLKDINAAVNGFTNVKFLEIVLHGVCGGVIKLADGFAMNGSFFAKALAANPAFLNKNARVLFDSCSIAAGESGDNFLDEFGKTAFRGKGGIVGGTTVPNIIFFKTTPLATEVKILADKGILKVRRYDAGGNRVGEQDVEVNGMF